MLAVGSKAPDFKVRLENGEIFRLRDSIGKSSLVLTFFPDDFTRAKADESYYYLQNLQKVQTLGAFVITISPKNLAELKKLLVLYGFSIPLATDPTLEVCRNYRALWLKGLALRTITYVIDKKGIIRGRVNHHLLTEKPWEQVMRLLKEIETDNTKRN